MTKPSPIAELRQYLESRELIDPLKDWVTEKQMLILLCISKYTLRNWRLAGKIGYAKIEGTILYSVPEFLSLLEKKFVAPDE